MLEKSVSCQKKDGRGQRDGRTDINYNNQFCLWLKGWWLRKMVMITLGAKLFLHHIHVTYVFMSSAVEEVGGVLSCDGVWRLKMSCITKFNSSKLNISRENIKALSAGTQMYSMEIPTCRLLFFARFYKRTYWVRSSCNLKLFSS